MATPGISAYLPPHLVWRIQHERTIAVPQAARFPAALLFSDISGFTSLTERLEGRGREGAEEIASIVNRVFRPAIRTIECWGGSITAFGGDALFTMFLGRRATRRALRAAEEIELQFGRRGSVATSAGRAALEISQALHYGTVSSLHLGSATRRHYVAAGTAVEALARHHAASERGGIALSRRARARARMEGDVVPASAFDAPSSPTAIRAYLPPPLLPHLGRFAGRFGRAALVFFETRARGMRPLQRFFMELCRVVDPLGGCLLKTDLCSSGVRWLVAFGVPTSHGEDVARAARAAEALVRTGGALPVRAGLFAGTVAQVEIGTRSRRSIDVMGDAVNTAARLVGAAAWGEVLSGADLAREVPGFVGTARGSLTLKGKSAPVQAVALSELRVAPRSVRVAAPFVGRSDEVCRLEEALAAARSGRGAALGIRGEAGIGKSRLVWEASRRARAVDLTVATGICPAFGGAPYAGIASLLRSLLDMTEGASRDDSHGALQRMAEQSGLSSVDRRHLADVLGIQLEGAVRLDERAHRRNNVLAVSRLLHLRASTAPTLYVLEDMHVADELTREVAAELVRRAGDWPTVLLLLYRPSFEPPPDLQELPLSELSSAEARALVDALVPSAPAAVRDAIAARAEGNPFYVDEVIRHLKDVGSEEDASSMRRPSPRDGTGLPSSVESLVEARLDALSSDARRAAQTASVIGRTFDEDLLRSALGGRLPNLEELHERELVIAREGHPGEHAFKHAISRDVAYATLLGATRRRIHARVARALETLPPSRRDEVAAMIGHHWREAGAPPRARPFFLLAARRAAAAFASAEAERLYREFLALLHRAEPAAVEARCELGNILRTRGRISDAQGLHDEALRLSRRLGSPHLEARALADGAATAALAGRMGEARTMLVSALRLAQTAGELSFSGTVLSRRAQLDMNQGRMADAQAGYDEALRLAVAAGDRTLEVSVKGSLAGLHITRGRLEDAEAAFREALVTGREMGLIHEVGTWLGNLGALCTVQGRLDEAAGLYEEAIRIHRETGHLTYEATCLANLGNMRQAQGRLADARPLYERAIELAIAADDRRTVGVLASNMGTLQHDLGDLEQAERFYEQALEACGLVEDRRTEAATLAFLGILHDGLGDSAEARRYLERAIPMHDDVEDRRLGAHARATLGLVLLDSGDAAAARRHIEDAERLHLGLDDPQVSAIVDLAAARLARHEGDPTTAARRASRAQTALAHVGDRLGLARCLCEQAHQELAGRGSPGALLTRAQALVAEAGAGPRSPAGRAVAVLLAAIEHSHRSRSSV